MGSPQPAPTSLRRPPTAVVASAIVLLCLLWGSTWVVIKLGLDDLPPFTSAAARFALAGIAMSGLTAALRSKEGGDDPPRWLWLTLGCGYFGVSYGLVYLTEARLPSGLVSVLWGVFPMLMAAIGHLYLPGERLRGRQWAGFALGFLGLLVLYATDVRSFGPGSLPVALLLLLSPLVSAVGTGLIKRHGAGTSSLALNRNGMLTGAVVLGCTALCLEHDAHPVWSPRALLTVAYLALFGTVATFGLYFWLLRTTAASRLGLIAYVTPAVALTLGAVVRGEALHATTLAGSALILSGVVLVVRGRR